MRPVPQGICSGSTERQNPIALFNVISISYIMAARLGPRSSPVLPLNESGQVNTTAKRCGVVWQVSLHSLSISLTVLVSPY
jgi:hypothetical protein